MPHSQPQLFSEAVGGFLPAGSFGEMGSEGVAQARADREAEWAPEFSPWRHGGWYVTNVRYPSGAVGCVSRNYADRKWRIVCDDRPDAHDLYTYPSRDAAARAERALAALRPL